MISNCGRDENWGYAGGKAGDQDGGEWALIDWYNRPWGVVLRHPDANVQNMIAKLAKEAAQNDNIGYDQYQRLDFFYQLQAVGYYPSKVKTPCEADCSSGTAAIVKAVGHLLGNTKLQNVSTSLCTWDIERAFVNAGFTALRDSKYRTGSDYLLPGDILLNTQEHVAINVDKGRYGSGGSSTQTATQSTPTKAQTATGQKGIADRYDVTLSGMYQVVADDYLCLRLSANTSSDSNIITKMQSGEKVACYGYYTEVSGTKWFYAIYNGLVGFCSSEYLKKI